MLEVFHPFNVSKVLNMLQLVQASSIFVKYENILKCFSSDAILGYFLKQNMEHVQYIITQIRHTLLELISGIVKQSA